MVSYLYLRTIWYMLFCTETGKRMSWVQEMAVRQRIKMYFWMHWTWLLPCFYLIRCKSSQVTNISFNIYIWTSLSCPTSNYFYCYFCKAKCSVHKRIMSQYKAEFSLLFHFLKCALEWNWHSVTWLSHPVTLPLCNHSRKMQEGREIIRHYIELPVN